MEFSKIVIDGKIQFKKSYLIYIIELNHNNVNKYYYIGQTGDRNYITARPPFLRLAGHLNSQESSTENQIYKGIAEKILNLDWNRKDELKTKVNDFLIHTIITMSIFPIMDFDNNIDKKKHEENRIKTEGIENELILKYIEKYGCDNILNKKYNKNSNCSDENIILVNKIWEKMNEI